MTAFFDALQDGIALRVFTPSEVSDHIRGERAIDQSRPPPPARKWGGQPTWRLVPQPYRLGREPAFLQRHETDATSSSADSGAGRRSTDAETVQTSAYLSPAAKTNREMKCTKSQISLSWVPNTYDTSILPFIKIL